MKKIKLIITFIALPMWVVLYFTGCVSSADIKTEAEDDLEANEIILYDSRIGLATGVQISDENISENEIQALQFLREEEKLARDVYMHLYETWELMPFKNISKSEQIHMDAILHLLNRYEINDPASDTEIGEFKNKDLQNLYDQLIEQGSKGVIEALRVGALIEETDINDIQIILDEKIQKSDIDFVLNNLKRASGNHLKAFFRNMRKYNYDYEPQILDLDTFQQIVE
jgi:hypothetical protein